MRKKILLITVLATLLHDGCSAEFVKDPRLGKEAAAGNKIEGIASAGTVLGGRGRTGGTAIVVNYPG